MSHKPTVADVEAVMGRTFTLSQEAAASPLLDRFESLARKRIRRPFDAGTVTNEAHVMSDNQAQIMLKNGPVLSVTNLTVTDVANTTTTTLDPLNYVVQKWGLEGFWNSAAGETVRVTYTHGGLDDEEEEVVYGVILSAVIRHMGRVIADAPGLKVLSAESTMYSWWDDGSLTFIKAEEDELRSVARKTGVG